MKIKVISDKEEFYRYKPGWSSLETGCNLFLIHDWLYTWWESYGGDNRLRIYVAEDEDGSILAILPLMLVGDEGEAVLTQLGVSGSDYFGIISSADITAEMPEIFRYILSVESYDKFVITNLRTDDPHTELLIRSVFSVFNDIELIKQGRIYFVDTSVSYEEYYNSRSKNYRHKLNQIARHADKYNFRVITEYVPDTVNEIMELHKSRWLSDLQLSVFYDQRRHDFVHSVCSKFAKVGRLRIFVLENENRIRAYRLGFVHENVYYDWNTAFDLDCKVDSVGIQLCDRVIRYCCENDICELDFLRGEEEYKRRFATGEREYLAIDIKRNPEIEGYVYQSSLRKTGERLRGIEHVLFNLSNTSLYDDEILKELHEFANALSEGGKSIAFADEENCNVEDVSGESTLVIGDDLAKISEISGECGAMTCLYMGNNPDNGILYKIDKKPDMAARSFKELQRCFESVR